MSKIARYSKILQYRNIFKKIQQLSWTISKLEQRFDIDQLNEQELKDLLETYNSFTPQLFNILDELKDESREQ